MFSEHGAEETAAAAVGASSPRSSDGSSAEATADKFQTFSKTRAQADRLRAALRRVVQFTTLGAATLECVGARQARQRERRG